MAAAKKRTKKSARGEGYPASWERLFAAVDPESHAPSAFLASVGWNKMDLTRIARQKRRISYDKLRELNAFCELHGLPWPFGATHPAHYWMLQIQADERNRRLVAELLRAKNA